jgi:hypothetical protein
MNSYPSTSRLRAAIRQRELQENRRTLQLNDVWRPRARTALQITCMEGRCWVTREGDPADYLLEPGMSFSVRSRDGVVAQALADGTVLLVE